MVLQALLAEVGELDSHFAVDLPVHIIGNADAARLCDTFKPRRDVDAVAEDVVPFYDDVAEIDPDAELNAPVFR